MALDCLPPVYGASTARAATNYLDASATPIVGMERQPATNEALAALRHLTLAQVDARLADLDAERASLSLLRRSLIARERVKRRGQTVAKGGRDG